MKKSLTLPTNDALLSIILMTMILRLDFEEHTINTGIICQVTYMLYTNSPRT